MKDHSQTMKTLDESINEAQRIKRSRIKTLEIVKLETERTKELIDKLNKEYGFLRTND